MKTTTKAADALLAAFPNLDSFLEYAGSSENSKGLQSFIAYAARHHLINRKDRSSLEAYIQDHESESNEPSPHPGLSFEELFDRKENLLEANLSARALTNRINSLLNDQQIGLPDVSNSMLTRLKREPADTQHKKNVLRSLAFWIGYEKAALGIDWDYETLLHLCSANSEIKSHNEGVRIGFSLFGRGDAIDHEIVGWLKKEIKNYIESSFDRIGYGRWGKVKSLDITTVYVDFPKEGEISNPSSCRHALRSAVSLAHQLSIRWALSKYHTSKRFLAIGITTGEFVTLDKYLVPILSAKLPEDPVIRITDFTRQCLLINDIRSLLCTEPKETTLFDGESLSIWWFRGFWSTIYYDFIPGLINDPILQNNPESFNVLNELLWFPQKTAISGAAGNKRNAISIFFKTPQNSLLGIEIAKTLYYRRRFWEAIEILKVVLSIYPSHLNARSLRMVIFRNLAVDAKSISLAEKLFMQAEAEAEYIIENCATQSEDFFCEYALVYMARGMLTLSRYRSGTQAGRREVNLAEIQRTITAMLSRAEDLFYKGLVISPSGVRSTFLLNSVKILKAIVHHAAEALIDPEIPFDAPRDILQAVSSEFHRQIGYLRDDFPPEIQVEFLEKAFRNDYRTYDDSVSLKAYHPTSHYCGAVSRWDFLPRRTVGSAKKVIQILDRAKEMAAAMMAIDICIYSFSRTYGEMIPAAEFIQHIENSIKKVQETVGDDLVQLDDAEVIPVKPDSSDLILTLQL